MTNEAVGAPAHQRSAGQGDDARRPEAPENGQYPDSPQLKGEEQGKPGPIRRRVAGNGGPQGEKPDDVQCHDQRVMATPGLDGPFFQQTSGIALTIDQFQDTSTRHQYQNQMEQAHAASIN